MPGSSRTIAIFCKGNLFEVLLLSYLVLSNPVFSQQPTASNNPETVPKKIFKGSRSDLPYRLVHPRDQRSGQTYPLLVYLHGMGSRGNDNEIPFEKFGPFMADSAPLAKFPCFILIPQCPQNDIWVAFPGFPGSLSSTPEPTSAAKNVLSLISELLKTESIDSNRIYLTGYSMGGEGTFDLIARAPALFACGVPLASVADTARAGITQQTPLWVFHGTKDPINDFRYSKLMVEALRKHGGEPIFSALEGIGHDCRNEAYLDPNMWKWMFGQVKPSSKK